MPGGACQIDAFRAGERGAGCDFSRYMPRAGRDCPAQAGKGYADALHKASKEAINAYKIQLRALQEQAEREWALMGQDSFVFYRSFYEAIREIDDEATRLAILEALCDYAIFGGEPELKGTASALFKLMRPQIDANRRRRENGKKGGAFGREEAQKGADKGQTQTKAKAKQSQEQSKSEPKQNQSETKDEPNANANGNANANENENIVPGGAEAPPRNPEIELLLNDKSFFPVMKGDVERWSRLYPAVDVLQELRKMAGWLDANPTRRKTRAGVARFITGWLAREQDKKRAVAGGARRRASPSDIDERSYAPGELEQKIYDPIEEILRKQGKMQ